MLDQKEENKEVLEELKKAAGEKVVDGKEEEAADISGAFYGDAEDEIAASEGEEDNLDTVEVENIDEEEVKDAKVGFINVFTSIIIDGAIMGAVTFIGLYLVDAILRVTGLYITDKLGACLIIFVVVYILYGTIMMSGKKHSTFGMRANKLKVTMDK